MAERWQSHVFPHGPIESLGAGLWQVTGSLKPSPLPRNMQIWRANCGGLLLHSPVCLDERSMAELESLGPVKWIVAPCRYHRADASPYQARFPEAKLLAPGCAVKQVGAVARVDGTRRRPCLNWGSRFMYPKVSRPMKCIWNYHLKAESLHSL